MAGGLRVLNSGRARRLGGARERAAKLREINGAEDEIRTRDNHLGKVELYH